MAIRNGLAAEVFGQWKSADSISIDDGYDDCL